MCRILLFWEWWTRVAFILVIALFLVLLTLITVDGYYNKLWGCVHGLYVKSLIDSLWCKTELFAATLIVFPWDALTHLFSRAESDLWYTLPELLLWCILYPKELPRAWVLFPWQLFPRAVRFNELKAVTHCQIKIALTEQDFSSVTISPWPDQTVLLPWLKN